jgi:outer membrane protein assembly factor BamB
MVNIKRKRDERYVSGCLFLPTGDILIGDYHDENSNKVRMHNKDGKHIRNISVSYNPFDLTLFDSERVAIWYGVIGTVDILNLTTNRIEKTFEHKSCCCGISYEDGRLYTVVDHHGIIVTDLLGKHLDTIKEGVVGATYITTEKDRIYACSYISNTVKCYSKTGELLWIFSDDLLLAPSGLVIDSNRNILVFGEDSNNLTVISRDCKTRTILLNIENGLQKPKAILYNKDNNVLLVCNLENGKAYLYMVT